MSPASNHDERLMCALVLWRRTAKDYLVIDAERRNRAADATTRCKRERQEVLSVGWAFSISRVGANRDTEMVARECAPQAHPAQAHLATCDGIVGSMSCGRNAACRTPRQNRCGAVDGAADGSLNSVASTFS